MLGATQKLPLAAANVGGLISVSYCEACCVLCRHYQTERGVFEEVVELSLLQTGRQTVCLTGAWGLLGLRVGRGGGGGLGRGGIACRGWVCQCVTGILMSDHTCCICVTCCLPPPPLQHLHDEGDCATDHPHCSRIQHLLGEQDVGERGGRDGV